MKTKRKSQIGFKGRCLPEDVRKKATTVRTRKKETWANCWDGLFILIRSPGQKRGIVKSIDELYGQINTVAIDNLVIAKWDKKRKDLFYIEQPYYIRKRK